MISLSLILTRHTIGNIAFHVNHLDKETILILKISVSFIYQFFL